jgi:TonB family protein
MKHPKDKPHKEKKFLKLPSYPGGNKEFIRFIVENLRYPEEALKNLVEGTVYLEYTVDNIGRVADEVVMHGIGHGCDEEALRLVRMLKYDPVKNRGVKMKAKIKTRICFELPESIKPVPSIQVTYVSAPSVKKEKPEQTPLPSKPSIGYTITIKQ